MPSTRLERRTCNVTSNFASKDRQKWDASLKDLHVGQLLDRQLEVTIFVLKHLVEVVDFD